MSNPNHLLLAQSSPAKLLAQPSPAKRKRATKKENSCKRQNRSPFSPVFKQFVPSPLPNLDPPPMYTSSSPRSDPPTPTHVLTPKAFNEKPSMENCSMIVEHQMPQKEDQLKIGYLTHPEPSDENKVPSSLVEIASGSPKKLTY